MMGISDFDDEAACIGFRGLRVSVLVERFIYIPIAYHQGSSTVSLHGVLFSCVCLSNFVELEGVDQTKPVIGPNTRLITILLLTRYGW